MRKIEFIDLHVGGRCNLFHHGEVIDYLVKFNLTIHEKMVYGLIGEFGYGGAAFSCGITGNTDYYEGSVYIDDKPGSIEDVIACSWYIGSELKERRFLKKPLTVRQQIEHGLNRYHNNLSYDDISSIFDLSDERSNRTIDYTSGERWKISAAIGYAQSKKIFCFPWLNTKDIIHLGDQFKKIVTRLLDFDCIVIIPTTKDENLQRLSSDFNTIYL